MRKIILRLVAAIAVAAPIAVAGSAHASGAPVTTTANVGVDVTAETPTTCWPSPDLGAGPATPQPERMLREGCAWCRERDVSLRWIPRAAVRGPH